MTRHVQALVEPFNNLNFTPQVKVQDNKKVHIMEASQVNWVLFPFEWNINPVEPQGIKIYLQTTGEIDKKRKSYIYHLITIKYIIYHLISLSNIMVGEYLYYGKYE